MKIAIEDRGLALADRLRPRLEDAARLRCDVHGQSIVSVRIVGRENGWFDAMWNTCCENLTRRATAILKERC